LANSIGQGIAAGPVIKHRGQVLDFLAMTFDFTVPGEARVTMRRLVDDILEGCGVERSYATPAIDQLFDVRDALKLGVTEGDYFRTYVAKLLFVAKRVKPEMLAAVAFLTTRTVAVVINTPPEFRPSPWVQVLMVEIHTRLTRINAHTEIFVKRRDTTGSQPHMLSILRFHSLGCPN